VPSTRSTPLRFPAGSATRTQGDDDRGRLEAALRTILGDPEALLLVAGPTGRALDGFAEAYRRDPPSSPLVPARPFGLLQSLFVEEAARGRGLGRAFVEEVERWLADQGVDEIRTDTWEFEGGPRGFYEALGYRTARRELTRTIGRNASESGL
jgi:GNAT superfamily N-acetyltransferase